VICAQSPEIAHLLKYARDCYEDRARPVVIAHHHYVVHRSLPYPVDTQQPHIQYHQLIAALLVDMNIFGSKYARWMLDDNRDRLLPTIRYAGEVIPLGLLDDEQMRRRQSEEPYDKPTGMYNHRIQAYKRPEMTFDMYDRLYQRFPDLRVVATVNNRKGKDTLAKYPFVTARVGLGYDDYLTELSRCHFNVTHTVHETFCLSAVESLAYGQWLVAPKRLTFPDLVPNGYPFLYERDDDAEGMVAHIINNGLWHPDHPRRRQLQNETRDRFTATIYANHYIQLIEAMNAWSYADSLKPQSLAKIAKLHKVALATGRSRIAMHQMRRAMERAGLGHQAMNPIKFKRILNQIGWRDDPDARGMWMLAPREDVPDVEARLRAVARKHDDIRRAYVTQLLNAGETVLPQSLVSYAPREAHATAPNVPALLP
jgi:glycosyltransferase involved in cell wall biosynthesis